VRILANLVIRKERSMHETPHPSIPPLLVGVSEACDLLSIKRTFLYRLISDGRLRPVKLGRRTMFRYSDLLSFADEAKAA